MLTSHKEVEHVLAALSYGAEGYLLKAIHPRDLAGIRVVHAGGTLISQEMASKMIKNMNNTTLRKIMNLGSLPVKSKSLHKLALACVIKTLPRRCILVKGRSKLYLHDLFEAECERKAGGHP